MKDIERNDGKIYASIDTSGNFKRPSADYASQPNGIESMFRGLSENKKSFHDSRASDTVSHELEPTVFRDKNMLSAIARTNDYEPNSTIG